MRGEITYKHFLTVPGQVMKLKLFKTYKPDNVYSNGYERLAPMCSIKYAQIMNWKSKEVLKISVKPDTLLLNIPRDIKYRIKGTYLTHLSVFLYGAFLRDVAGKRMKPDDFFLARWNDWLVWFHQNREYPAPVPIFDSKGGGHPNQAPAVPAPPIPPIKVN